MEVVLAILLYLVGKQVIKLIRKIVGKSLERHDADVGVRQFLDSVIKYALYFLLWLMILTLFGVTLAITASPAEAVKVLVADAPL